MKVKQLIQNYKTGELKLIEVPIPIVKSGGVLVRNINSLVSAGTEKLMIDLAKKSLLGKAKARPDLVKQVINKVKTDGLMEAYKASMSRLDNPVPLGYSCAGKVMEVGNEVDNFRVGDKVACFGSGYASHSEVVFIPKNLCVKIPENVDYESAAFVGLGAIALHSVRMAEVRLGDNIVIIGLGLLGLIAVQLVKAAGGNVLGVDIDEEKVSLALKLGADEGVVLGRENVISKVEKFSKGYGADAVIILASTDSNQPIELAAEIARERAKIVVPGMVKLDLPRKIFYEKELQFVVSRSTGPGIYDSIYEEKGVDYPIFYVRWTEKRNMQEFLELIGKGKVILNDLITHHFNIEEAEKAYQMIIGKSLEKYIGVLLSYNEGKSLSETVNLKKDISVETGEVAEKSKINVGMIGAGLFAKTTLLPLFKKYPFINLCGIATATGSSSKHAGDKFSFDYCTSKYENLLDDEKIDCIVISTRHNLHAKLVIDSLKKGKNVFVEKPLALTCNELKEIIKVWKKNKGRLMVGFNRRFSPFSVKAKEWLGEGFSPMVINCRVNAGFVPKDSWVQDLTEGGGRIVGEVCHFIDLIQYFTGSLPVKVFAETISGNRGKYLSEDNLIISVKMKDGSVASITYVANGDKSFPRERIEIFGGGKVCVIDDFKSMTFICNGKKKRMKKFGIDRGYYNEFEVFFSVVKKDKPLPVDFEEYVFTTLATFSIMESIRTGAPVDIDNKILKL
jgi:predicted dehydrogenase/threonine dehydrogenase-like Zn-dependent dehydrogenase